eukprot:Skav202748  [mRNA]  locus=scaffold1326:494249:502953:- [translate_table: standard]
MARRYHWGTFFSGFRDSRDGCDLAQFSRMLADPDGLCFCDEAVLQVELAELEMSTCRPYFSRMVSKEVDFSLATKKYQRSSAGKTFEAEEVRSPKACLDTMIFLMETVLEADLRSKESKDESTSTPFAITEISFGQVYSYLHDRCRAVRVDLHLQQPRSSQTEAFVTCHEYCLRFEVLSRFLFRAKDAKDAFPYDERLGLQAISQTIDPLLAAYRDARDRGKPFETEAATQRLVVLLLLATSPQLLPTHLAALDRELLQDPVLLDAIDACAAFQSGHYARFLRFVASESRLAPLGACILTDLADLARLRLIWLRARAYPKETTGLRAFIQKQIEQLKRGRPGTLVPLCHGPRVQCRCRGKLLDPAEKLKLERLRQEEADLKVRFQESRAVLEQFLQGRAVVMLQARSKVLVSL